LLVDQSFTAFAHRFLDYIEAIKATAVISPKAYRKERMIHD
jgi:hypothetical protein